MRLTDVRALPITKDDEMTSLDELVTEVWSAGLSPENIAGAIAYKWGGLQQVPSYVEGQIEANRGLIESIASQR
jgi:hypothetical protein